MSKKVGIIGYGSMGSMLLHGFAEADIREKTDLYVSTANDEKLSGLKESSITVCPSNRELAKTCDVIFICVKPIQVCSVLEEIKAELTENKHLVSIAGSVTTNILEQKFPGKISRCLPTLISEVKEGVTLIYHNDKVFPDDGLLVENLLGTISTVKQIPEKDFEIVSDLTSCAPGLIAAIFSEYVNCALAHTTIDKKEVTDIVIKTLFGTAKLFHEKGFDFETTIKRVATKGGATEAGANVLKKELPPVFTAMFNNTLHVQKKRQEKIEQQFFQ